MNIAAIARRMITIVVLVSLISVTASCYGPFNLTRNVYHWNGSIKGSGEVNDKWMKEIVFFGMIVIPVYMFSALLDAFVFNSIQFWSGDNPIKVTQDADGHIKEVRIGETVITVTKFNDGRSMKVSYTTAGTVVRTATVVETATGYVLIDRAGHAISEGQFRLDGGVTWLKGDCTVAASLSKQGARAAIEYVSAL